MVKGSCVCGDWKYEYKGDPVAIAICHCIPCRKTAGHNGSTNAILPTDKFNQLSGTDRTYSRQGDSGKQVKYHNCSTCNTIMWVEAEAMQGMMIVKTGTIDDEDALNKAVPVQEIYCVHRPESFGEYPGIAHKEKS